MKKRRKTKNKGEKIKETKRSPQKKENQYTKQKKRQPMKGTAAIKRNHGIIYNIDRKNKNKTQRRYTRTKKRP